MSHAPVGDADPGRSSAVLPPELESIETPSGLRRLVRGVGRVVGVIVTLWLALAVAAGILVPGGGSGGLHHPRAAVPLKSERFTQLPPAAMTRAARIHPNGAVDLSCVDGAWRWITGLDAGLLRPQDVARRGIHAPARKRIVMIVWTELTTQTFWHGHLGALRLAREQIHALCARARPTSPVTQS
jgi:hypothetical protein